MRLYYIISNILFEIYFFYLRRNILKSLQYDWYFDRRKYEIFQKRRLKKIFAAASKTAYYKNIKVIKIQNPISQLYNYPVVNKSIMKENYKSFINRYYYFPHTKKNTGGSTGEPFSFFVTYLNRQCEFAHQRFFYDRFAYKAFDKIYSFGGIRISEDKKKKNIYWKRVVVNFPFGCVVFTAHEITKNSNPSYVKKILTGKPKYIRGYPSAISKIAEFIISKNLQNSINFVKAIMLTAENVTEDQILVIGKAFNCPVLPQYGMTEGTVFAFTEENQLIYYCSPYYSIVEVLDDTDNHVKIGEQGRVVTTSLINEYQPFIRYETGDLAIYGGVYNGFTILKKIIGRTQDYIFDSKNNKIMVVGLIHGSHSKIFEDIYRWQILQYKIGEIDILIQVRDSWNKNSLLRLHKMFNGLNVKINVEYTDKFVLSKIGKQKLVVQKI